ncbi:hypothetical protein E2C01_101985 [Portunus trituberculatus]|uniref:Transposase Tc1-like domain-containing protein n=1 Tax=Portunus trituberculatus TaxID=210409 RepID=A0A5B7K6Y4_PORTR|nr:hypothetical protein [Portunus trituberculatus]
MEDRRKGGNHPRATTEEEDQSIVHICETNPHLNAQEIKERLNIQASVKLVRKRLHEAGFHHRIPAIKDILTQRHKEQRFEFAEEYQDKELDFWGRVVFSEEKTFSSAAHGKLHCWRRNGTRSSPQWIRFRPNNFWSLSLPAEK